MAAWTIVPAHVGLRDGLVTVLVTGAPTTDDGALHEDRLAQRAGWHR